MSTPKSPKKKSIKTETKTTTVSATAEAEAEWTSECSNKLLDRMEGLVNKPDTSKYTSQIEKLSWQKVAFPPFTPEQCKARWIRLSKEIRKFRTLSELVTDARDYLKDPYKGQIKKHPEYPKRPLTPYFRFFMEKRDGYATKHKSLTNLEVTAELSKKYRALPAKKKQRYIDEWQKEHQEYLKAMARFKEQHPNYFQEPHKPPSEPRTPAQIMKDDSLQDFIANNPTMTKKECVEALKKKYKNLPDDQKQFFIAKALDEKQVYKRGMEDFVKKNPTYVRKTEKQVLTKYEKKLNDRNLGKPEKPPLNGYNLFCIETMPNLKAMLGQKRIVECGRLWNLLDAAMKQEYHNRCGEMKRKYEINYSAYLETLTPEERAEEEELSKAKKRNFPSFVVLKTEKEQSKRKEDSSETSDSSGASSAGSGNDSSDDTDDDLEDLCDAAVGKDGDGVGIPPRPVTPISALFLYQKAHRKQVQSQYTWMTKDAVAKLLARRYQELPKHKRHKYVRKERELRAIYNAKMQEYIKNSRKSTQQPIDAKVSNGECEPQPPVQPEAITGEQLYHEKIYNTCRKKYEGDEKLIEQHLHNAWNKLNKARREPFIKKAQKENETNIMAYSEAKKKYDAEMLKLGSKTVSATNNSKILPQVTYNQDAPVPATGFTTNRKKIRFEGQPKKPPTNGYQLFNSMQMIKLSHLSHSEKFKEIGRLWSALDAEKKESFNKEVQKQNEKYKKLMEQWLKTLTSEQIVEFHLQKKNRKRPKGASSEAAVKKAKVVGEQRIEPAVVTLIKEEKSSEEKVDDKLEERSSGSSSSDDSDTSSSSSDESDDESSSSSSSDSESSSDSSSEGGSSSDESSDDEED